MKKNCIKCMINLGSFRTRIAKFLTIRGLKGPVKQSPKLLLCKIQQKLERIMRGKRCMLHKLPLIIHRGILLGVFCGSAAVTRSVQKNSIREKFQNTPYYQLYSPETDLIQHSFTFFLSLHLFCLCKLRENQK